MVNWNMLESCSEVTQPKVKGAECQVSSLFMHTRMKPSFLTKGRVNKLCYFEIRCRRAWVLALRGSSEEKPPEKLQKGVLMPVDAAVLGEAASKVPRGKSAVSSPPQ